MFQNLGLLFLRFFIAVREINYPSCFIVYYEMKLRKKKRVVSVIPLITQQTQLFLGEFAKVLSFSAWISTSKLGATGENLNAGSGTGWYNGFFHKSLKPLCDWPGTLTLSCELLKLDCDWLSRSHL